jgi:adenylylsulfate kinase
MQIGAMNHPARPILIDGRTFLRSKRIDDLCALAATLGKPPRIIECICTYKVARQRLERDLASRLHPAKNRTFALYLSVKEQAGPLTIPHLVLDTSTTSVEESVRRCLGYLRQGKL